MCSNFYISCDFSDSDFSGSDVLPCTDIYPGIDKMLEDLDEGYIVKSKLVEFDHKVRYSLNIAFVLDCFVLDCFVLGSIYQSFRCSVYPQSA